MEHLQVQQSITKRVGKCEGCIILHLSKKSFAMFCSFPLNVNTVSLYNSRARKRLPLFFSPDMRPTPSLLANATRMQFTSWGA